MSVHARSEIFNRIRLQHSSQIDKCSEPTNLQQKRFRISHRELQKIHHFWINLPRNTERYNYMNSEARRHNPHMVSRHVEALGHNDVLKLLSAGRLRLPADWNNRQDISTKTIRELACTLSHLKAIQKAYDANIPFAVITEDDVQFVDSVHLEVHNLFHTAPKGWQVIQLLTVNPNVRRRFSIFYDADFVKWYPNHWSTAAYIISRQGMRFILDHWLVKEVGTHFLGVHQEFTVPEEGIHLADETLYYLSRSYTYTRNIVYQSAQASHSSIQSNGKGLVLTSL